MTNFLDILRSLKNYSVKFPIKIQVNRMSCEIFKNSSDYFVG